MSNQILGVTIAIILWIITMTTQINAASHAIAGSDKAAPNPKNKTLEEAWSSACRYKEPSFKSIIFITIFILIFFVGLCGNCTAVVVIMISKPLRAMPTNIFLAALALSDIGAIVFIIPIRVNAFFHAHNFCFTMNVCHMFNFTDSLFHVASISHLFLIAVERFVAVNSPFFYQRVVSKKTTAASIFSTWIYALAWACLSLFDWERPMQHSHYITERPKKRFCVLKNRIFYYVSFFAVYIVPLVIMGSLYLCILRIALNQARVIKSLSVVCKQHDVDGIDKGGKSSKQQKEVRATKTLAIIYGTFAVCWLPVTVISITLKWYPDEYRSFRLKQPVLFEIIFSTFIEVLPTLNSALNPFIYIIFNKKFRCELDKLYHKYRHMTPPPSSLSRLGGAGGASETTVRPSTVAKPNYLRTSHHQQEAEYLSRPSIQKEEDKEEERKGSPFLSRKDEGAFSTGDDGVRGEGRRKNNLEIANSSKL